MISFEYHAEPRDLEKTLAALNRLSRFGSLDINITPAEVSAFHFDSWMSLQRFLTWFPDGVLDEPAFRYGDIFVRIQSLEDQKHPPNNPL